MSQGDNANNENQINYEEGSIEQKKQQSTFQAFQG